MTLNRRHLLILIIVLIAITLALVVRLRNASETAEREVAALQAVREKLEQETAKKTLQANEEQPEQQNPNAVKDSINKNDDDDTAPVVPVTPTPVHFASENKRHVEGAAQRKLTPQCDVVDDVPTTTILTRASPTKNSPMCYYTACNFCVTDGALEFFSPRSGSMETSAETDQQPQQPRQVGDLPPLRLCNELRSKINLPVIDSDAALLPAVKQQKLKAAMKKAHQNKSSNSNNNEALVILKELGLLQHRSTKWIEDQVGHVVACWQFYGYHLFQCSVSAFYAELLFQHELESSQFSSFDRWLYNHAVTIQKQMREHFSFAMYLGSNKSWTDPVRRVFGQEQQLLTDQEQADERAVRNAPWWGMWAATSKTAQERGQLQPQLPSSVNELFRFPRRGSKTKQRKCYRRGIIGQPVHRIVPISVRHRHIKALRSAFGIQEPQHVAMPSAESATEFETLDCSINSKKRKQEQQQQQAQNSTTTLRVLVCQRGAGNRQGSRRILNADAVVRAIERVFSSSQRRSSVDESGVIDGVTPSPPTTAASHSKRRGGGNSLTTPPPSTKKQRRKRWNQTTAEPPEKPFVSTLTAADFENIKLEVDVVDFATLSFDQQMRLASSANVMISTHGAGNVWLAFLPRGRSVLVELWPQDYVARDVYREMCYQYDVKYVPVFAHMEPLFGPRGSREAKNSFLHQDVVVPIDRMVTVLERDVAPFVLRGIGC